MGVLTTLIIILVVGFFLLQFFWNQRKKISSKVIDLKGLKPISNFDLNQFYGRWYEQRRFNSSFEPKELQHVTATYLPFMNNLIKVVNSGWTDQTPSGFKEAQGTARLTNYPGVAEVSFFPLIESEYVVLYLDDQVLIPGSPNRQYLWLLTRTPTLFEQNNSSTTLELFQKVALENGYTRDQLQTLQVVKQ